jgi:TonB family protein
VRQGSRLYRSHLDCLGISIDPTKLTPDQWTQFSIRKHRVRISTSRRAYKCYSPAAVEAYSTLARGNRCFVCFGVRRAHLRRRFGATGWRAKGTRNAAAGPTSPGLTIWKQSLATQLAKAQRYPAQAHGVQGVANLAFTLDRNGKLVSSRIVKSSGSPILDAEALDLIKRAAPLPPPPADIVDSDLSFIVPIHFSAH